MTTVVPSYSLQLAAVLEDTPGVTPTNPVFNLWRTTGEGLVFTPQTQDNIELNGTRRMRKPGNVTGVSVAGDINFELAEFPALFEALAGVLANDWGICPVTGTPAGAIKNATYLSVGKTLRTYTIEKRFPNLAFVRGDAVTASVTSAAPGATAEITVAPPASGSTYTGTGLIVLDIAVDGGISQHVAVDVNVGDDENVAATALATAITGLNGVTATAVGPVVTITPDTAVVDKLNLRAGPDEYFYQRFKGTTYNSFSLNVEPNQIITGRVGIVGGTPELDVVPLSGAAYIPAGSKPLFTASEVLELTLGDLTVNSHCFFNFSINLDSANRGIACVGTRGEREVVLGKLAVDVNGEVYFADQTVLEKLLDNETVGDGTVTLTNSDGNYLRFDFFDLKPIAGQAIAGGEGQDVTVPMTLQPTPAVVCSGPSSSWESPLLIISENALSGCIGICVSGVLSASSTEGTNPDALTLIINATDDNGDPIAWSISESLTWASFSPASGTGTTSVTVTLDPTGVSLAPGTYEGEFVITAAGAANSPYTGTLSLTHYATPVLNVTPVSLDFGQIIEGDGLPAARTLTVTNSASPAGPMTFTAAGPSWLTVSQSGATVTVRPNTGAIGTYSDDVTITSASASNSPWTVPVTFDVQEQPAIIVLSASSLLFAAEPDSAPANQTVTVTSGGTTPVNFTVSDDAPWLTVVPTSGTDGQVLTISCSAQAVEDTYNATITVTDPAAINSPQTIAVNYAVSVNPIVGENLNSADAMSLTTNDYGDIANQGFATEQSVNVGETIDFKVHGDCQVIDIFRCGYYGGGVYRKVATISNTPTSQPAAVTIPDTNGATTCAAWSVTASWDVPTDAVSGMYIAVVRNAALNDFSNIIFFVREDAREADIVVKVSDSTWGAAYNPFNTMGNAATIENGADLYGVGYLGSIETRSTQVSFDRPLITRNNVVNHPYNYELGLISFLEEQGYNVKYVTCYDLDINRGIGTPKVLISVGHDEYWSQNMRDRVIALQNAGTHILWMS
ncbi:MAG: phage tail tube protein, partial [Caldilineaceae bacterium]